MGLGSESAWCCGQGVGTKHAHELFRTPVCSQAHSSYSRADNTEHTLQLSCLRALWRHVEVRCRVCVASPGLAHEHLQGIRGKCPGRFEQVQGLRLVLVQSLVFPRPRANVTSRCAQHRKIVLWHKAHDVCG